MMVARRLVSGGVDRSRCHWCASCALLRRRPCSVVHAWPEQLLAPRPVPAGCRRVRDQTALTRLALA
jgi:hypothetical protein